VYDPVGKPGNLVAIPPRPPVVKAKRTSGKMKPVATTGGRRKVRAMER
jgi:hypothetical protein